MPRVDWQTFRCQTPRRATLLAQLVNIGAFDAKPIRCSTDRPIPDISLYYESRTRPPTPFSLRGARLLRLNFNEPSRELYTATTYIVCATKSPMLFPDPSSTGPASKNTAKPCSELRPASDRNCSQND